MPRCSIELEELTYEIISRKVSNHVVPDCMSRNPLLEANTEITGDKKYTENGIFSIHLTNNQWLERLKIGEKSEEATSFARCIMEEHGSIKELKIPT